jgi:hypothetical protein
VHVVRAGKPAVSIRRVNAEPAIERDAYSAAGEIAWLALWPDRSVGYFPNADALVREVRRRDQRDAARADRLGRGAVLSPSSPGTTSRRGSFLPRRARHGNADDRSDRCRDLGRAYPEMTFRARLGMRLERHDGPHRLRSNDDRCTPKVST